MNARCWIVLSALALQPVFARGAPLQNQGTPTNPTPPRSILSKIDQAAARTPVLMLSGSVLLEDNSPPPERVMVELVCDSQVIRQVSSGNQGHFRIEIADRANTNVGDPSVSGQGAYRIGLGGGSQTGPGGDGMQAGDYHHRLFGKTDFSGCEVRVARSAGYSSDVIRLGVRGSLESPDIGVLTLRPLSDAAGTTVSLTTLSAPEKAREAYESAREALGKRKPDTEKANKKLQEAVEIFPGFAAAWDLLARTRFADRDFEGAQNAFERAVEADEKFLSPYLGLAQIEIERQDWAAAIKLTQKVIELNPKLAQSYYLDGLAHFYQGDLKTAEMSLLIVKEKGYSRAYPMALLHLGIIHTSQGNVPAAVSEFQGYLEFTPAEQIPEWHRDRIQQQVSQWESQGLIDEKTMTAFSSSSEVPRRK
jgi:hypothetical protein